MISYKPDFLLWIHWICINLWVSNPDHRDRWMKSFCNHHGLLHQSQNPSRSRSRPLGPQRPSSGNTSQKVPVASVAKFYKYWRRQVTRRWLVAPRGIQRSELELAQGNGFGKIRPQRSPLRFPLVLTIFEFVSWTERHYWELSWGEPRELSIKEL